MVFKTDEDMSLDKYWEKHCISIAKDRRWAIQKGDQYSFENCATLRQYDDYIKKVASYLDMSISEITPANILHAVSKVAKACQYQEATVKTIISSLRDVFSYAATCGHAYNILSKNRAGEKSNNLTTLMMQRILVPAVANAELSDNCPRALTIGQQGRLALYAAEHVREDGRFCGILISLYTGMRPAECRGLRWNDFRSFPDHPDRHYLKIDEILNDKLEYSKQVKTKNALRCVPVHIEIEDALQKRREFVQQNMGANKDIGELPIACFGNQFKDPCRGSDYSNFSFKLLKEFGVSSEQLGFFLLDESDNLTPSDSHPPMRILRRNFATVIQACTDMSLEEKEYMENWKKDSRKDIVMVDVDGLVPQDHLLRKVERVMDYDWLYERLSPYYCADNGRPGTDPVVLIKMVLIQHLFGIASLRQTYRDIQVNVAYRWFLGYSLLEEIPHFATVSYAFCKRFPPRSWVKKFLHIF